MEAASTVLAVYNIHSLYSVFRYSFVRLYKYRIFEYISDVNMNRNTGAAIGGCLEADLSCLALP